MENNVVVRYTEIINSASEFEESDDEIPRKRWRERRRPKKCRYKGACAVTDLGQTQSNSAGQFSSLKLHTSEIDKLDVPVSPGALFKLFFTPELVASICELTNAQADIQKEVKPEMYKDWVPLTPEEFYKFLALLLIMTCIRFPRISDYWSEKRLFKGTWSQSTLTKSRYKQIQAFLRVSETIQDRREVDFSEIDAVYECMQEKCMKMWETEPNCDHNSLPLDKVKDVVTYFWEDLDADTRKKGKGKVRKTIAKYKKGWLLLEGFGKLVGVQWKDREVASALLLMHKDLKRGVLDFQRYKIVDNSEFGGAFRAAENYGSPNAHLMVGENDVLISTTKAWKAVLYHLIDVAWLTSYFMFEQYRTEQDQAFNPHVARLSRYEADEFITELATELAGDEDDDDKMFHCYRLLPNVGTQQERCARCCHVEKVVRMTSFHCLECEEYFCFSPEQQCLTLAHSQ